MMVRRRREWEWRDKEPPPTGEKGGSFHNVCREEWPNEEEHQDRYAKEDERPRPLPPPRNAACRRGHDGLVWREERVGWFVG